METLTYGQLKDSLARVSGFSGMRTDSTRLLEVVNQAQRDLFFSGMDLPWVTQIYCFSLFENRIALPQRFAAIDKLCFDYTPISLMNQWYEFISDGPGPQINTDSRWVSVAIDRGTSPVARQPSEAMYLRVYSYEDERSSGGVRPTILIKGYDADGKWVRSQSTSGVWSDGVTVELCGDSSTNYADTPVKFSSISEITKDATNGRVGLYYVDNTDSSVLYVAGELEHDTLSSSFRIYDLPANGSNATTAVQALCRLKFREVAEDTDTLIIPSVSAMKYMIMSLADIEAKKFNTAATLRQMSYDALAKEIAYFYPSSGNPAISIEDSMPPVENPATRNLI